jgi:hypothetical protein
LISETDGLTITNINNDGIGRNAIIVSTGGTTSIVEINNDGDGENTFTNANGNTSVEGTGIDTEGGAVNITASGGGVTVSKVIDSGAGLVTLTANGANSDVNVNDSILTTTGGVTILADDEVNFGSTGAITNTISGDVAITANANNSNGGIASAPVFIDFNPVIVKDSSASKSITPVPELIVASACIVSAPEFAEAS